MIGEGRHMDKTKSFVMQLSSFSTTTLQYRYLDSLPWGSNSLTPQGELHTVFRQENRGLKCCGADLHPNCFTASCGPSQ